MKIFIFYGNKIVEGSSASLFVDLLIEQLEKKPEIESVVLRNANNTNLRFMNNWKDVISTDEYIEREVIRSEILQSNVFFFISPVYLHNVSAFAKLFLDNFASWSHTMPLIGKLAIPISLSSSNGNQFVNDYLSKILSYWGLSTLNPISIELSLTKENALSSYIRFTINNMFEFIYDLETLTNKMQEDIYRVNWNSISNYEKNNPEYLEFERSGNLNHNNFRDALKSKLEQSKS